MDIITISNEIYKRISQLEKSRKILSDRAEQKAESISNYDKELAITIFKLKNGEEFKIDDVVIKDVTQITLIEKVARGICWKQKLEVEKADGLYKAAVSGISSLESELNGLQSLFRYMKEM